MDSFELDTILRANKITRKYFGRVLAANEIHVPIKYPISFVINSEPLPEDGQHWIALFFRNNRNVEVFCSFGKRDYSFILF